MNLPIEDIEEIKGYEPTTGSLVHKYNLQNNRVIASTIFETDWVSHDESGYRSRISVMHKDRGGILIASELPQTDRGWIDESSILRGSKFIENSYAFNSDIRDSQISKSNVVGSIIKNCTITNAWIYNCRLENCHIENYTLSGRQCVRLKFFRKVEQKVEIQAHEITERLFKESLKVEILNILNEVEIEDRYNEAYASLLVYDKLYPNARGKVNVSPIDIKWAKDFVEKRGNVPRIQMYWSHIKETK